MKGERIDGGSLEWYSL